MKKAFIGIAMVLVLVGLVFGCVYIYNKYIDVDNYKPGQPVPSASKIDSIKGYDYVLYDDSTELYKTLYYELKDILETETIDEAKYAEVISKMFIADFYTLSTKVTNQDVGGLDFIYSNNKDNFKLKASNTLYKYIESNVYGDRKQKLPEVTEFISCVSKVDGYNYKDKDSGFTIFDTKSYIVDVTWNYKEDLGYDNEARIRLVHEGNILSIVSVESI